jgi:L-Ala-D/L-Glu epimerase
MVLKYKPYQLQFRHPFGVSSNTRSETTSVFIQIEAENQRGYGEACLPAYLGETAESCILFFEKAREFILNYDPTLPLDHFLQEIGNLSPGNHAAKAALDIALHDLYGKILNQPFHELTGISKSQPAATSFTIGIDANTMEEKIAAAAEFKILKIKAGTPDDRALITRVRQFTDKPLFVDVNQGWRDKEEVLEMLLWMHKQNVVLVEQPMPVGMKDAMKWVTERSPVPTIADESIKRLSDLEKLDGEFSGINIKLMKCTGLNEAMKMIRRAQEKNLKVMLGCMAESSCGTTAMAQLMQFADHVDLDAPLLYRNDPFHGITFPNGMVTLNDLPGNGANPNEEMFFS